MTELLTWELIFPFKLIDMKSIQKLIIAISVCAGASITSCQKLNIAPTNVITPAIIFSSEAGVDSYLATIYRALPIEDFKYRPDAVDNEAGFNPNNPCMNFYSSP